jgi:hypothetical protein
MKRKELTKDLALFAALILVAFLMTSCASIDNKNTDVKKESTETELQRRLGIMDRLDRW